jgi:hypothetical protein
VYLAGAGRSGSTLLARLLGEIPGFLNIGEAVAHVTNQTSVRRDVPCGCGEPLERCPFWAPLVASIDVDARREASNLIRLRSLPVLLSPLKRRRTRRLIERLAVSVRDLLTAAAERSDSQVIVDSSKNPAVGYVLSQIPEFDLEVVHLVRDSRGFASSRAKPKDYLKSFSPLKAASVWTALNLGTELLRLRTGKLIRVRYEDLVLDPRSTLGMLAERITGANVDLDFVGQNAATVGVQHIVAGNPDKFSSGSISIAHRSWTLPPSHKMLVSSVTSPLLLKYGYFRSTDQPSTS